MTTDNIEKETPIDWAFELIATPSEGVPDGCGNSYWVQKKINKEV